MTLDQHCAYCSAPIPEDNVEYTIHRDGMDQGPEVPLCEDCGSEPEPTCEQIWARISQVLN